jgi:hypothetical protein
MVRTLTDDAPPPPGFHYDTKNHDVIISDQAVDRISTAIEHIISESLRWAQSNPNEFYAFLAFLAFALLLSYLGSLQRKQMEIEYEKVRSNSAHERQSSPTGSAQGPQKLGHDDD